MHIPQRRRDRRRPKPALHLSCTTPASIRRSCPAERGWLCWSPAGGAWRRTSSSISDGGSEGSSISRGSVVIRTLSFLGTGTRAYTEGKEGRQPQGQGDDKLDVCILLAGLDELVPTPGTSIFLAASTVVSVAVVVLVVVHGWRRSSKGRRSLSARMNSSAAGCRQQHNSISPPLSSSFQPGQQIEGSREKKAQQIVVAKLGGAINAPYW